MEKEFYIYLSSRDSIQTFSSNTSSDFSVVLPDRVHLNREDWSCGLVDLTLPHALEEPAYLCSNICQETITGTGKLPVLRRVIDMYTEPSHVIHVPLKSREISIISMYLERENGIRVAFTSGTSYATLHFMQNESLRNPS